VTIKFTHEATLKGYSFLAGEVCKFPDEIGELMVLDGVAFRVPSVECKINRSATDALNEARERDGRNNFE
jgi:hypothetical protein